MAMAPEARIGAAMAMLDASGLAPAFTLNDQRQTAHRYDFPRPKISVLIFADYAASAQLENWIQPLYDRYRDAIAIDGVAVLSKAPRLLRGIVRAAFRDRLARPVMLDWSGAVSSDYQYEKGEANLFVIAPNGRILVKVVGAISAANLQRVRHTIDDQLNVD
jgi:hypothetical protein